jgi:hypothetical protein
MILVALVFIFFAWLFSGKGIVDTATHLIAAEQAKGDPEESLKIANEGIKKGAHAVAMVICILIVGVLALIVGAMSGDPRMTW